MQLYEIKNGLRDHCIMDVSEIDGIPVNSLDEYLYQFPLQRKLAYAYLKESEVPIELSKLHKYFKNFDNLDWLLHSVNHKRRMKSDEFYEIVVNKYIRNPYTWISSMLRVQPYLFDAKYLLIGQFQSIASRCTWNYFHTQTMHYSGIYNGVRTLQGLEKHNHWFTERLNEERNFFDSILKKVNFSTSLKVKAYYKYIEVFDDVSKLTLQFELDDVEIKMRLIFPKGSRQRGRKSDTFRTMKLLTRYYELFSLYTLLTMSTPAVQAYLDKLKQIDLDHQDTHNRLTMSLSKVLDDFIEKSPEAYFDDRKFMSMYMVNNQSVERISFGFSKKYRKIRVYRTIKILNDKLNRTEEIQLSSYTSINSSDTTEIAKELLASGFINIGSLDEKHSYYDYELLATGKSKTFALQFLKLPQVDASNLFAEYAESQELLDAEIKYLTENNLEIKDTRVKLKHDDTIDTYFELKHKNNNDQEFSEDRTFKLSEKRKSIKTFSNEIKKLNKND